MTHHEKDLYLRKYKQELLDYSLGREYLPIFEYKDGKIITERAWIATYDYVNFDGMVNANTENGYPLCKEDIVDFINYLKDLKKKALSRSQMKSAIMNYYIKKIKHLESIEITEEKKVYKRTTKKHYIYFARFGKKNLFKVGFSKNPKARVKQLQLLTTDTLKLEALIPIDIGIRPDFFEKKVQEYLEDKGLKERGELFSINTDQLNDVIKKFGGEIL